MISENILKFISFNLENFDLIQTVFYSIITLSIFLLILWLIKDLNSRIESKFLKFIIFVSVLLANIVGFLFYLVLRPRETIYERSERLILSKRQEVTQLEENLSTCAICNTINKSEFKFCVGCGKSLKLTCSKCSNIIQPYWSYCPKCQTVIELKALLSPNIKPSKKAWIIKFFGVIRIGISNLLRNSKNLFLDMIVKIIEFTALFIRNISHYGGKYSSMFHYNIRLINRGTILNDAAGTHPVATTFTKNTTRSLKSNESIAILKQPHKIEKKKGKKRRKKKNS